MDKYIWSLYDHKTGKFGTGNLVFQKRENGLFYDGKTQKPLVPQPPQYIAYMENMGRKVAFKYL